MKVIDIRVSDNLIELRKRRGLKQEDVAKAIGVTIALISYFESGGKYPSLHKLVKLAEFYGVSLDTLVFGGDDNGKTDL